MINLNPLYIKVKLKKNNKSYENIWKNMLVEDGQVEPH